MRIEAYKQVQQIYKKSKTEASQRKANYRWINNFSYRQI